jgi:uncharacterized protein (TIGR00369 family)
VRTATVPGAGGTNGTVVVVVVDVVVDVVVVDVVAVVVLGGAAVVGVGVAPVRRAAASASAPLESDAQAASASARRRGTPRWVVRRPGITGASLPDPQRSARAPLVSTRVTSTRADTFEPLPPHRVARWSRVGKGPTTHFAELLGLVVEDVRHDYCRMRLPWRTEIAQPFGVAHGGALASLVDAVLVPAIGGGYEEPVGFATIDLSVQYLGALRDEDAVAEGWVVQRGTSIAFTEAEVRGATSDRLIARGIGTYKISRPKDPADIRR